MKSMLRIPSVLALLLGLAIAQQPLTTLPPFDEMRLEFVAKMEGDMIGRYVDKDGTRFLVKASAAGEAETKRMNDFTQPIKADTPLMDAAIAKLRKGEVLGAEEVARCEVERSVYYDALIDKYKMDKNTRFCTPDQVQCYLVMIRMALIDPVNHGGWPFRSTLRLMVRSELKNQTADSKDPFLHFCAVFPSLARQDVEHAVQCMKFIQQHDPFLAENALAWAKKGLPDSDVKKNFIEAVQPK